MEIHIGEKIKKRARELRIGPSELGKMVNTSKQNMVSIYKRESIDALLLSKISKALRYNFFVYYESPELIALNQKESAKEVEDLKKKVEDLTKENQSLKEKVALVNKINTLLEKKRKGKKK